MRVMREESELFSFTMETFSQLLIKAMDLDMSSSSLLFSIKLVLSTAASPKSNQVFLSPMIGLLA